MIEIRLHHNAQDDMRRLIAERSWVGPWLKMILSEMRDNEDLQDALLIHNESVEVSDSSALNSQKWLSQYNGRNQRNLWRLKPLHSLGGKPLPFRIIYAYNPPVGNFDSEIWVLAVLKRNEFNYQDDNFFSKRIVSDYECLD